MPRLEGERICVLHLTPERPVAAVAERTALAFVDPTAPQKMK